MKKELVSVIILTRNRKNDLKKCLESLQKSTYKRIEVIILDNGSRVEVSAWAKRFFPEFIFKRSEKNLGAAGGRNYCMKFTKGDYLLFIDDDTKIEKNMISELVEVLKNEKKVGIVHPKIYDMSKKGFLQGIGCDINLISGRVSTIGIRERDYGQYDNIKEISAAGCIWMVKREVIEKIGGYDEVYFTHYEDPDFSYRARKVGFKIYFVPKAQAWHKSIQSISDNRFLGYMGIRSVGRAYRVARNKMIFMRKFSPFPKDVIFFFFFMPIYAIIHSLVIIVSGRLDVLYQYWLGVFSGLWYSLTYSNFR